MYNNNEYLLVRWETLVNVAFRIDDLILDLATDLLVFYRHTEV